jgi:hypothetical protein
MKPDPKPLLGAAACDANMDYYRNLRIKAHSEYLYYRRQERYWREKLQLVSDSTDCDRRELTQVYSQHCEGGVAASPQPFDPKSQLANLTIRR